MLSVYSLMVVQFKGAKKRKKAIDKVRWLFSYYDSCSCLYGLGVLSLEYPLQQSRRSLRDICTDSFLFDCDQRE